MALKGTIESFGISEIFQLIAHQGKTGILEIGTGVGTARLRFLEGRLVEAWPDRRGRAEFIGTMLVRAGMITSKQLEFALDKQKQSLQRLGDILVRMGAIRLSDFGRMLALQHRETFYRVLGLKRGEFEFRDWPVKVEEGVSVPMDLDELLMEGFRQVDEWPRVREKIPSERKVYARVPDPPVMPELEPRAARVLELVDGVRTVREVVDRAQLGEFHGWEVLADLYDAELITPVRTTLRPAVKAGPVVRRPRRLLDRTVAAVLVALAVSMVGWSVTSGVWPSGAGFEAWGTLSHQAEILADRHEAWLREAPARWPAP